MDNQNACLPKKGSVITDKVMYMIVNLDTGEHIPTPDSVRVRGFSRVNPTHAGVPRLFTTEQRAKDCLREWRKGIHGIEYEDETDDYISYKVPVLYVHRVPNRKELNMAVVPVKLQVKI